MLLLTGLSSLIFHDDDVRDGIGACWCDFSHTQLLIQIHVGSTLVGRCSDVRRIITELMTNRWWLRKTRDHWHRTSSRQQSTSAHSTRWRGRKCYHIFTARTRAPGSVAYWVNVLALRQRSGVRIQAMSLVYWVTISGKLFTHIASPVFSAPRNWDTKRSFQTGPI